MELANFSAKLEPFLLMAKSLKGAAAAKLIQDATSAPGVFVFSELLELLVAQRGPVGLHGLLRGALRARGHGWIPSGEWIRGGRRGNLDTIFCWGCIDFFQDGTI